MDEFKKALNLISLLSAIVSALMVLVLGWLRPRLIKRTSIQLQTGVALLDITRHLQLHNLFKTENNVLCTLTAFYGFYSDQVYIFLNVVIALNLHLMLLKKIQPKPFLKWVYWAVSIGVPFSVNLAPLHLGYFGKGKWNVCYLTESIPDKILVKFFLIHMILWPGVIYCFIISSLILYRYFFKSPQIDDDSIYSHPEFRQLSWTIALYPFTCFLTMLFYMILSISGSGFLPFSKTILDLSQLASRSTGSLNLFCMMVDRQVWHTIKSLWNCENKVSEATTIELSTQAQVKKSTLVDSSHVNIFAPHCPVHDLDYEQEPLIVFL